MHSLPSPSRGLRCIGLTRAGLLPVKRLGQVSAADDRATFGSMRRGGSQPSASPSLPAPGQPTPPGRSICNCPAIIAKAHGDGQSSSLPRVHSISRSGLGRPSVEHGFTHLGRRPLKPVVPRPKGRLHATMARHIWKRPRTAKRAGRMGAVWGRSGESGLRR